MASRKNTHGTIAVPPPEKLSPEDFATLQEALANEQQAIQDADLANKRAIGAQAIREHEMRKIWKAYGLSEQNDVVNPMDGTIMRGAAPGAQRGVVINEGIEQINRTQPTGT